MNGNVVAIPQLPRRRIPPTSHRTICKTRTRMSGPRVNGGRSGNTTYGTGLILAQAGRIARSELASIVLPPALYRCILKENTGMRLPR